MPAPRELGVSSYSQVDAALRYHRVIDVLDEVWRDGLDVLEVGSGSGGIARYLKHPVTGVDSQFERTSAAAHPRLKPVAGSVLAIPADDSSFDVVVSVEMMEHLAPGDRPRAVQEVWRVLRPGGVAVVTFPAGSAALVLDGWLNSAHEAKFGRPHPWVAEHIKEGVPEAEDIARVFREGGAQVDVAGHLSVDAFYRLHGLYTIGWGGPIFGRLFRSKHAAKVVFRRLQRDNGSQPAYRAVVTARKPVH